MPAVTRSGVSGQSATHAQRTAVRLPSLAATVADTARYRWLTIAAPAVIFLAVRAAGVLLLWWMSARHGKPLDLHRWDGEWYLSVARHGYGLDSDPYGGAHGVRRPFVSMAFFPLYPWLVSLTAPMTGGRFILAAVTVSTVAGVVAAYGVARLARHVTGSQRAGLIAVVLFAAAPSGIVYSMSYAEALFCALMAWALVGVVERRWLLAGLCAATAGLARPTAVAVVAVVAVVALWEVLHSRGGWKATTAVLIAPLGLVSYYGWVANETGDVAGYWAIQREEWSLTFDGGVETAKLVRDTLMTATTPLDMLTVGALVAAVVLLVIGARQMPWPLWVCACMVVVLTVGTSGVMTNKIRELLPAVVLLLPVAATLARQRATVAVTLTTVYVLAGLWVDAISLTAWPYAI